MSLLELTLHYNDSFKGACLKMKYFRLADKAYRETVDLRLYEDDITAAVAKVKPDAQLFVECDGFYTIPALGKRESILVSQELRKNSGVNRIFAIRESNKVGFLLHCS